MSEIVATAKNYQHIFSEEEDDLTLCKISSFQRSYVWKTKNINDLITAIDEADVTKGAFLGNLILQMTTRGASGYDDVIDGQQRLVTFSLLLVSLKEVVDVKNFPKIDSILFKLNKVKRIKFQRKSIDDVYKLIISSKEIPENLKPFAKNFQSALTSIRKKVLTIDDHELFLNKVFSTNFVLIKIPHTFPVYSVFESLNSKGVKLKAVELVKNNLLGSQDLELQEYVEIEKQWDELQMKFERRAAISEFDTFLRYRTFQDMGYVTNQNLFEKLKRTPLVSQAPLAYSEGLNKDADVWILIRDSGFFYPATAQQTFASELVIVHSQLKKLLVLQVYSVLFALDKTVREIDEYSKGDYYAKDILKLYYFSLLSKVLKIVPSRYEKIYAIACNEITRADSAAKLNTARKKMFDSLARLISDADREKFVERLNEVIYYNGVHSKKYNLFNDSSFIIVLILLSQGLPISTKATIEHIIPKKTDWRTNWAHVTVPLDEERYCLGNFTCLQNDLAGSGSFESKTESYANDFLAGCEINKRLISGDPEDSHVKVFMESDPRTGLNDRGKDIARVLFSKLRTELKYKKIT